MELEPVSTTYVPPIGVVSVRTKGINRSSSNFLPSSLLICAPPSAGSRTYASSPIVGEDVLKTCARDLRKILQKDALLMLCLLKKFVIKIVERKLNNK